MEVGDPVLEALFAGAPAGLAYWDADVRYRRVNPRQAEIHGIPAEDHLGRTPSELLGPAGERIETLVRQVLQTGAAVLEVELTAELPAAPEPVHWLASFFPVPATGGVGGIVVDVTERKAVEARERAARARAEALAGASAALTSSMRTDRVLSALVHAVVPALADFSTIHLRKPDGEIELIASAHADPELETATRELGEYQAQGRKGPASVIRTGRPLVIDEPAAADARRSGCRDVLGDALGGDNAAVGARAGARGDHARDGAVGPQLRPGPGGGRAEPRRRRRAGGRQRPAVRGADRGRPCAAADAAPLRAAVRARRRVRGPLPRLRPQQSSRRRLLRRVRGRRRRVGVPDRRRGGQGRRGRLDHLARARDDPGGGAARRRLRRRPARSSTRRCAAAPPSSSARRSTAGCAPTTTAWSCACSPQATRPR